MPNFEQSRPPRARRTRRQPPLPGLAEVWEPAASSLLNLRVTFDQINGFAEFVWTAPGSLEATAVGTVHCTGPDQLTWEVDRNGHRDAAVSSHHRNSVRAAMERWLKQFPTRRDTFTAFWLRTEPGTEKPVRVEEPFAPDEAAYRWIEDTIVAMANALRPQFSPLGKMLDGIPPEGIEVFETYRRRLLRKGQKREEKIAQRRENMERLAEKRRQLEQLKTEARLALEAKKAAGARAVPKSPTPDSPSPRQRELPPLPVRFEMPALALQETAFPLADLRGFFLRERAALWWASNQSDDLL